MQALVDLVFVNRRLEVRFLSPAPYHTSCDPRAIHRFIATSASVMSYSSLLSPIDVSTCWRFTFVGSSNQDTVKCIKPRGRKEW